MTALPSIELPFGRSIGGDRVFVIAEVGSNHAARLETALASVEAAAAAGADAVKFQSIDLDALYHQPGEATRRLHEKIDFPEAWHAPVKERCDQLGIVFFSSPTYPDAIDVLETVDVSLYKLASAQIGVFPQLVRRVAELGKPVILSTGLVTGDELARVVEIFHDAGNERFVILHCNSVYPAPPEIVHLPRMLDYRERFGCHVGFSDHTVSHTAAVAAVALGATVIERHFTLSRRLDSPDAPLSLEPGEFRALVQSIREAEQVLRPAPRTGLEPDELAFKQRIRHCLLATADIAAGERVDSANAVLKRGNPGEGIDAWAALGHPDRPATAAHAIAAGRWITLADLNPGDS